MNILSIQSHVAYGHVGNSAAVFALQRLGIEGWPVHTVQFSNHTGYGGWRGRVFDGGMIRELVQGIEERGALPRCDAVLSGYMGDADIGEAVLEAVHAVKRANCAALYCCDPVIGDIGRDVYVRPGVAEFMRERAAPAADILTPNHFELEHITGRRATTLAETLAAIDALHAAGPATILVTSLITEETPPDAIDLVASDATGRWRVRTPRLPVAVNGTGDLIAALFLARVLQRKELPEALALSTASVFGILRETAAAGSREIALIAAQDQLVAPTQLFEPERV